MKEAAILLHLLRLPSVGPVGVRKILAGLESMGSSLQDIFDLSVDQLAYDLHFTPEQISMLHYADFDAEEDLKQCIAQGVVLLRPSDPGYPHDRLKILGRSLPSLLFLQGNLVLLERPALGVSGSRQASESSLAVVTRLCEMVSSEGWVVISGGAKGSDEATHLAAVRAGPGTIVVLPTGIFKPNIRQELGKHFEDGKVLLISEFPPEQGWTAGCAMQRNRLIAALSKGVVLVEPGLQGGTGGTGKIALKMGVPLYVLNTELSRNKAVQSLMENGAELLSVGKVNSTELVRNFDQSWEVSRATRSKMQSQDMF